MARGLLAHPASGAGRCEPVTYPAMEGKTLGEPPCMRRAAGRTATVLADFGPGNPRCLQRARSARPAPRISRRTAPGAGHRARDHGHPGRPVATSAQRRSNAMSGPQIDPQSMKDLLFRSVWLPALVTAALLAVALGLLVSLSWRSLQRLEPVHDHLLLMDHVQEAALDLQQLLVNRLTSARPTDPGLVRKLRAEVDAILARNNQLSPRTPSRLRRIRGLLANLDAQPPSTSLAALGLMRAILSAESRAHNALLTRVHRDAAIEFEVVSAVAVAFPALILLALYFLRRRILLPLNDLQFLMTMLAQQDYSSAPTTHVAPMLRPLFDNYNQMVTRLAELEQAHKTRQLGLENEVRAAARTLLEQQRNLAGTERLAAVGELAAGLAHELRNPLAGIQMALGNLRRDVADPENAERIDLVIAELKRLTRLLNDLLSQARQAPEPARDLQLAPVVDELLALARYQIPVQIRLESTVAAPLRCSLPEAGLRQAVLNLVLNAADALGERSGMIRVSALRNGAEVQLTVVDDGPGFPKELLDNGIRPFATGREHGTGLGLAMVRRFAADLGGRLELADREPHGACVTLWLPCKESHHG
ncbi:MAG: hypothetical protein B7Z66_02940 [Chromatiales bacterium 21-64-14]|nr:MAG: hypothetical protein B7Z66_02940 [Chromatiales bacterium 21-64-14]